MTDPVTEASKFVVQQLAAMVAPETPYRVGVLLLTHPGVDGVSDCRIAQGVVLKTEELARSALDLATVPRALRELADEIEATMADPAKHIPDQDRLRKECEV